MRRVFFRDLISSGSFHSSTSDSGGLSIMPTWATTARPMTRKRRPVLSKGQSLATFSCANSKTFIHRREWEKELLRSKNGKGKPFLGRAIVKAFYKQIVPIGVYKLSVDYLSRFTQPILVGLVVQHLTTDKTDQSTAILSGVGIILFGSVQVYAGHHGFVQLVRIGNNIRSAINILMYNKLLRLSSSSLGETDFGHIVTILANDLNQIEDVLWLLPYLAFAPIGIVITAFMSYYYLGISFLTGFLIMILLIFLQALMSKFFNRLRSQTMKITDQRVSSMGEIISAMKLIKLYCWERPFASQIDERRKEEVAKIRRTYLLEGVNYSTYFVATKLMMFTTLVTYILIGHQLDEVTVFVILSLYNSIRLPITDFFPWGIGLVAQILVAFGRVEKFLLLEEIESIEGRTNISSMKPGTVKAVNYSAKWSKNATNATLININLDIEPGKLVTVVGPVGAGKSSLLMAFLKEIECTNGSVSIAGKISYAPQDPWCFNGTVRENIIMNNPFDQARFSSVIKVCGLARDLTLFNNGDMSLVGEKGYSLSGGQRARLSLARAVYNQADIYLLDDPLSAVDPKVANQIFQECICNFLKSRTVVLVTHQLQFIQKADTIAVIEEGAIVSIGNYTNLVNQGVNFLSIFQKKKELTEKPGKGHSGSVRSLASDTNEDDDETAELNDDVDPQEETAIHGRVSGQVYSKYFTSGSTFLGLFIVIFSSILSQALSIFSDLWLSAWTSQKNETQIDASDESGEALAISAIASTTEMNLIIYTLLMVALMAASFVRIWLVYLMCLRSSVKIHDLAFSRIIRAQNSFFETNPLGRILNRFTRDIAIIDQMIPRNMVDMNVGFLDNLGIFVICIMSSVWLAIPFAVILAVTIPCREYFIRTSRSLFRLDALARSPVYSHVTSSFTGLISLRAFTLQTQYQEQFLRCLRDSIACRFVVLYSSRLFGALLDLLINFFIAAVCIVVLALPRGTIAGSDAGLILSASLYLAGTLQYMVRVTAEFENNMVSTERVLEYSQLQSEAPAMIEGSVPSDKWPVTGTIEFRDVVLAYSPTLPPVLKNISFTIRSLEKIGIVGRTGAGKSSLISALFRLTELQSGSIFIDSLDISKLGLDQLRRKLSIIPQDPSLFSGKVRMNLDPFGEYTDEAIWTALHKANMDKAVKAMNGHLDFKINKGGSNLSVGQRQLLCLARALLKNNRILILDEATANVDHETDEIIQQTIRREFTNYTVLTVAHRLNTVIEMDRIMVLDEGRVVEFDVPHLLLQDPNGYLTSMVKQTGSQFEKILRVAAERAYEEKHISMKQESMNN